MKTGREEPKIIHAAWGKLKARDKMGNNIYSYCCGEIFLTVLITLRKVNCLRMMFMCVPRMLVKKFLTSCPTLDYFQFRHVDPGVFRDPVFVEERENVLKLFFAYRGVVNRLMNFIIIYDLM